MTTLNRSPAKLSSEQVTWQLASLLLAYPDDALVSQFPLFREILTRVPLTQSAALRSFMDVAQATPVLDLAAQYVETFDHQRRCCLYLTYYAHGDTRNRGMALLEFKSAFSAAGLELNDGELPDHLAVVLEFAATIDPAAGRGLLIGHRAGVELLRLALQDKASPWASVLVAICATLPPLRGDEHKAIGKLASEGPPSEEVGLAPFAPPEYMPIREGAR
ncbi:MAG TPA: nitrate reductase molybdenum cofactor assembly chaperone [Actinomycetes bacterium]|nr:nitrate reductase molybdenum cofactor assembly chaperone [Actinomycetes bacterium]